MSELPDGVDLVEIPADEWDWNPCPTCGRCRWYWTRGDLRSGPKRFCMDCKPPSGLAFRLLKLANDFKRFGQKVEAFVEYHGARERLDEEEEEQRREDSEQ